LQILFNNELLSLAAVIAAQPRLKTCVREHR